MHSQEKIPSSILSIPAMGPMHSAHPFALSDYPKPTIVFVPNAWFPTTAYAYFLSVLRERGYTVETINHTSLAPLQTGPSATALGTPPTASTETDAFSLRQQLLQPLVEQQYRDVILLMHGYGTKVGMSAVRGLSKVQRLRENLPGGICGMIAVSPVVCQANTILYERKNPLLRCAQRDVVSFDFRPHAVPKMGMTREYTPVINFANSPFSHALGTAYLTILWTTSPMTAILRWRNHTWIRYALPPPACWNQCNHLQLWLRMISRSI